MSSRIFLLASKVSLLYNQTIWFALFLFRTYALFVSSRFSRFASAEFNSSPELTYEQSSREIRTSTFRHNDSHRRNEGLREMLHRSKSSKWLPLFMRCFTKWSRLDAVVRAIDEVYASKGKNLFFLYESNWVLLLANRMQTSSSVERFRNVGGA